MFGRARAPPGTTMERWSGKHLAESFAMHGCQKGFDYLNKGRGVGPY
jgi:hypothetical protein